MGTVTEPKKPSDTSKSQTVTEEKQVSLSAAKDRAQLTATTAMSVVHVALLKSLVDGGPDANRYYIIVIVLIIIALAVQVVVGFLAIFVTHTRNYYHKYRKDMCSEFTDFWCKCFSHDQKPARANEVDNPRVDLSVEVAIGKSELADGLRNGMVTTGHGVLTSPTAIKNDASAITTDDSESISVHVQLLQAELAAIEAEFERGSLNLQLEKETNRRRDVAKALEAGQNKIGSGDVTTDLEKRKKDLEESEKRILEIEAGIVQCDATMRRVEILRRQDKLLSGYVDDTLEGYVLKKVSFWQNVINYLLYTVFVCNVFITGLGVSGGQSETSGGSNAATGGLT